MRYFKNILCISTLFLLNIQYFSCGRIKGSDVTRDTNSWFSEHFWEWDYRLSIFPYSSTYILSAYRLLFRGGVESERRTSTWTCNTSVAAERASPADSLMTAVKVCCWCVLMQGTPGKPPKCLLLSDPPTLHSFTKDRLSSDMFLSLAKHLFIFSLRRKLSPDGR